MMKATDTSPTHWRHAKTSLPPMKKAQRQSPADMVPAGQTFSGTSLHLSVKNSGRMDTISSSSDSYVRHPIERKQKVLRPNFDSSKVSGLGYAVSGLAETTEWVTTKQESFDNLRQHSSLRATQAREKAAVDSTARQTPTMWGSESKYRYGTHTAEIMEQCKARRGEVAETAASKKTFTSRIQLA